MLITLGPLDPWSIGFSVLRGKRGNDAVLAPPPSACIDGSSPLTEIHSLLDFVLQGHELVGWQLQQVLEQDRLVLDADNALGGTRTTRA